MRQTRTDIEVMSCVRSAGSAARAIAGTSALKPQVQNQQTRNRHDYNMQTGRKERTYTAQRQNRSSGRKPVERAEIIDFRNAAGYTIPDTSVSRQLGHSRKQTAVKRQRASRRSRKHFRHSLLMLAAGLFLGIIMTLAAGMITRASSVSTPVSYKYYDTVAVRYGESADDIIDRYMDPVHYASRESFTEEFCRINCLETDSTGTPLIHPGIHLVVPYYSEEVLY